MEWLTWEIEIYVCIMTHLNVRDTCICICCGYILILEIRECMMTYKTDGDIRMCDGWHEWQVYIYIMIYMSDKEIWLYYELHRWKRYMDLLWITGIHGYVMSYINDMDI